MIIVLYRAALLTGGLIAGFAFLGLFLWRVGQPKARTNPFLARYDPIALLAIVGMMLAGGAVFGFW